MGIMSQIHREGLMFKWITKDHEIVVGFQHTKRSICNVCGRRIPYGNTISDACFEKEKKISKK